jgi:hypothetical protein
MVRTIPCTLAAAAMLFLSPIPLHRVQGQQLPAPIELNQSLLDSWFVAMPRLAKLGRSDAAPQTDDAADPHVERICAEGGFDSLDQCGKVIGYVGVIIATAYDWRSRTFRDPIVLMRRRIARIEADTRLSPEEKAKATSLLKQMGAEVIPAAHLRLMNANRRRVSAALARSAR